jgi:hypothetical protein
VHSEGFTLLYRGIGEKRRSDPDLIAHIAHIAHGPFAHDRAIAEAYYREFVAEKVGSKERLWEQLVHGIFLGGEGWIKRMRKVIDSKPRSSDHPRAQRSVGRPKMDAVITAVAKATRGNPRGNPPGSGLRSSVPPLITAAARAFRRLYVPVL